MEIEYAIISSIVDMIEEYAKEFCTHPNDTAKLYAASRLVDQEVSRRMFTTNIRNERDGTIFVGHCLDIDNPAP